MTETSFLTSLISGGMAGMAVDISLFPLDTIKTRLQSKQGFWAAGGFKNIYSGKINLFTLLIFDHEIIFFRIRSSSCWICSQCSNFLLYIRYSQKSSSQQIWIPGDYFVDSDLFHVTQIHVSRTALQFTWPPPAPERWRRVLSEFPWKSLNSGDRHVRPGQVWK